MPHPLEKYLTYLMGPRRRICSWRQSGRCSRSSLLRDRLCLHSVSNGCSSTSMAISTHDLSRQHDGTFNMQTAFIVANERSSLNSMCESFENLHLIFGFRACFGHPSPSHLGRI